MSVCAGATGVGENGGRGCFAGFALETALGGRPDGQTVGGHLQGRRGRWQRGVRVVHGPHELERRRRRGQNDHRRLDERMGQTVDEKK